jgi:SHS2 domain-containing protein
MSRQPSAASQESPEGYAIFAVTADKGIRAWGADPAAAFRQAARGLSSLLVEPAGVCVRQSRALEVSGDDREGLLVAWLNEILFVYETEGFVCADCALSDWADTRLRGVLHGEILDPARHVLVGQVKAATYHQVQMRETEQGWEVRAVVDV